MKHWTEEQITEYVLDMAAGLGKRWRKSDARQQKAFVVEHAWMAMMDQPEVPKKEALGELVRAMMVETGKVLGWADDGFVGWLVRLVGRRA
jgi:hypothetical protein